MIRDPSDGSVRDAKEISPEPRKIKGIAPEMPAKEISGLPTGSKRAKQIARLEASRAWLKTYHAEKDGSAT